MKIVWDSAHTMYINWLTMKSKLQKSLLLYSLSHTPDTSWSQRHHQHHHNDNNSQHRHSPILTFYFSDRPHFPPTDILSRVLSSIKEIASSFPIFRVVQLKASTFNIPSPSPCQQSLSHSDLCSLLSPQTLRTESLIPCTLPSFPHYLSGCLCMQEETGPWSAKGNMSSLSALVLDLPLLWSVVMPN